MKNILCLLIATILTLLMWAVVSNNHNPGPDLIIPGKLFYRPFLDCRALGGAQVLEISEAHGIFSIKAVCGTGLIYNYVYTAAGEVEVRRTERLGLLESGPGEVL